MQMTVTKVGGMNRNIRRRRITRLITDRLNCGLSTQFPPSGARRVQYAPRKSSSVPQILAVLHGCARRAERTLYRFYTESGGGVTGRYSRELTNNRGKKTYVFVARENVDFCERPGVEGEGKFAAHSLQREHPLEGMASITKEFDVRRFQTRTALGYGLLIVLPLLSWMGCASSEKVNSETARAMSSPGIGPEQFVTQQRLDGINVGDQIQLTVLGYPEFNTTANVRETGMFVIPLAGEVKAIGLTKDQLSEAVVAKLTEYVKTKVYITLSVVNTTVRKIIVLGAVGSQGSQPAMSPITLYQLFASVGGLSTDADLRHVRIYRNTDLSNAVEVDLSEFSTPGSRAETNVPLVNPGDMVFVPRSENFMREFSPFIYDILVLLTLFRLIS